MKKHKFRMDSFLKIKEFEEKTAWSEFLRQEARVLAIKKQISDLHEQQSRARQKMSQVGLKSGPELSEVALNNESLTATKQRIELLSLSLGNEERILEKLRLKHIESKKELKTIEKLKENDISKYKTLRDKYDAKITTEIGMQIYNRGKVENE